MRKLNYWVSFFFLFVILYIFKSSTDYQNIQNSYETLNWFGQQEIFSGCLLLIFIGLFLSFLYDLYSDYWVKQYSSRRFKSFLYISEDFSLTFLFLVVIFFVLPSFIMANGFLSFVHLFILHSNEITQVLPDITVRDFFVLCVEGTPVEPSKAPSMGSHIITAGVHEGKNYVCADIKEMVNRPGLSNPAKIGVRGALHSIGIPDVMCSGLPEDQIPASNQSVTPKK